MLSTLFFRFLEFVLKISFQQFSFIISTFFSDFFQIFQNFQQSLKLLLKYPTCYPNVFRIFLKFSKIYPKFEVIIAKFVSFRFFQHLIFQNFGVPTCRYTEILIFEMFVSEIMQKGEMKLQKVVYVEDGNSFKSNPWFSKKRLPYFLSAIMVLLSFQILLNFLWFSVSNINLTSNFFQIFLQHSSNRVSCSHPVASYKSSKASTRI